MILNSSSLVLESVQPTILTAAFGALGAILGALIGGAVTGFLAFHIENLRIKNGDYQKRLQAYSRLLGYKNVLITNLKLYHDESLWAILQSSGAVAFTNKHPDFSQLYDEMSADGLKSVYRSRDLEKELANCFKDFWEIIGTVQILFPRSNELNNLINKIYLLQNTRFIKEEPDNSDPTKLMEWWKHAQKELHRYIYQQMEPAIMDLLSYLRLQIEEEDK